MASRTLHSENVARRFAVIGAPVFQRIATRAFAVALPAGRRPRRRMFNLYFQAACGPGETYLASCGCCYITRHNVPRCYGAWHEDCGPPHPLSQFRVKRG